MVSKDKNDGLLQSLWRSQSRRKTLLMLLVVLAGIAFYFLLYRSEQVKAVLDSAVSALAPVLIGLVLAYLLNPLETRLQTWLEWLFCRRSKKPQRGKAWARAVAIGISVLLVLCLLVLLCVLVLPEIGRSIARAAETVPKQVQNVFNWINVRLEDNSQWAVYLKQGLQKGFEFLQNWASTSLPGLANSLLSYVTTGVIGAVKAVFNIIVALVVTIYVLKDKHKFLAQSKKLLYALCSEKSANRILDTARHAHKIVGGYLIGMIIESLIVGAVCFAVLSLLRMPYALLVSVIVCVTNIIPFFGPIIGAVPSALLILLADPRKGLIFIIFIVILQQVEGNIIAPRVLGDSTGVSAFWVTFALLLFGNLFGFVGMLIAVPLFAVLYYLLSLWVNERLRRRQLPTATNAYTTATAVQDGQLIHEEPLPPVEK